jgi:hypothetical protein
MSTTFSKFSEFSKAYLLFQAFKYSVYALLSYNIYLFFLEDLAASSHTFVNGVDLYDIGRAFSATIDTLAWVILIVLFELETFVLDDDKIKGFTKWALHGIRSLCYLFIIYSLYGYIVKLDLISSTTPFIIDEVCSLANTGYAFVFTLDEYLPIDTENCMALANSELVRIGDTKIISTTEQMANTKALAWVSVFNSIDWLLIVAILEIDVYLQLKGKLEGKVRLVSKIIKAILYSALFAFAIFWGFEGDFLDFWDAFLWLVAFIFIELNIFEWHAETTQEKAAQ